MSLIKNVKAYLNAVVGLQTRAHMVSSENMPVFITAQYKFYVLNIETVNFLGVELRQAEDFRPSVLEKHQKYFLQLEEAHRCKGFVIIAEHLVGFIRRRLVELKVPFVVPKMQLYWPEMGMEFREHVRNRRGKDKKDHFDPATQAVLIGALNGHWPSPVTPKELAETLRYTPMTMTRALDNLEAAGIGTVTKKGRQRFISFPEKRDLWQAAKPMMNNPVRDSFRVLERDVPEDCKLLAGEAALAKLSPLTNPQTSTYAVDREKWKKLEKLAIRNLTVDEPGVCVVQVWRYSPDLFAQNGMVDVFSLYLNLAEETDDRIEIAMEDVLEARL
jgi:hypothetical protein